MDIATFEKFLQERFKVDGKLGALLCNEGKEKLQLGKRIRVQSAGAHHVRPGVYRQAWAGHRRHHQGQDQGPREEQHRGVEEAREKHTLRTLAARLSLGKLQAHLCSSVKLNGVAAAMAAGCARCLVSDEHGACAGILSTSQRSTLRSTTSVTGSASLRPTRTASARPGRLCVPSRFITRQNDASLHACRQPCPRPLPHNSQTARLSHSVYELRYFNSAPPYLCLLDLESAQPQFLRCVACLR